MSGLRNRVSFAFGCAILGVFLRKSAGQSPRSTSLIAIAFARIVSCYFVDLLQQALRHVVRQTALRWIDSAKKCKVGLPQEGTLGPCRRTPTKFR